MMVLGYLILCLVVGLWFLISKALIASLREMANPVAMFARVPEDLNNVADPELRRQYMRTNAWAADHGFRFDSVIHFTSAVSKKTIKCLAWRNDPQQQALAMMIMDDHVKFDMVTKYDGDRGLTTTTSIDGGLLPPPPGKLMQAFPGKSLDEIWPIHLAGEAVVAEKYGTEKAVVGDIVVEMANSVREQAQYAMRLPLWQLRGPYWFFVRRHLEANKTVAKKVG